MAAIKSYEGRGLSMPCYTGLHCLLPKHKYLMKQSRNCELKRTKVVSIKELLFAINT